MTGAFNAGANSDIFLLSVISTQSGAVVDQNFQSAQAIKDNPGQPDNNTLAGNTVIVPGPGRSPDNQIPEPGTVGMLGIGLLAVGFLRRR
jgi:hypothetical protein